MKKIYILLFALYATAAYTQHPENYYNTATGKGYELKTQLFNIIKNSKDTGYNWTTVNACDIDRYYENDGTILDIYSENPAGTDPYTFTVGADQCGTYSNESECYNREHIFPQGFFRGMYPMRSDYHHIVPTDGKVNGIRDNYPFGEVGTARMTTRNGSKLGYSNFPGYSGTVFEPINEFKGDVARMLLYFVTRYESQLSTFNSSYGTINGVNSPLDGTADRGYEQWYINLLLKWHNQDPVSQREIDRNNCIYSKQSNRNPYIDHPEYVTMIWSSTLSTADFSNEAKTLKVSPNPVKNSVIEIFGLTSENTKIEIYSIGGQLVQTADKISKISNQIHLKNLAKGIYILKAGKQSVKFVVE